MPESVQALARVEYYRALEIQKRLEEGDFISPEEEYYTLLDEFKSQKGYVVVQVWNGEFGDRYQMVTTLSRIGRGGREEIRWFYSSPGGALSFRPDGLPQGADPKRPNAVWVPLPSGTFADWRWGEDGNIYLFAVEEETREPLAWYSPTQANALTRERVEAGWETYGSGIRIASDGAIWYWDKQALSYKELWFPNGVVRAEEFDGQIIGLDAADRTVMVFEGGEWLRVEREVGIACSYYRNRQVCEGYPVEVLEPLPENRIKRLYDAEGNPEPWGLHGVEQRDSGVTHNFISGIIRGVYGIYNPDAGGVQHHLVMEVPLRSGSSQYIFWSVTNAGAKEWNIYIMLGRNTGNRRLDYKATDRDLIALFSNPQNIGEQVMMVLVNDYQYEPGDSEYKRKMARMNDDRSEFLRKLEEGEVVDILEDTSGDAIGFWNLGLWVSSEAWNRR
jgi:hypothetical protein